MAPIDRREFMEAGFWLHDLYKTELLRPEGLWKEGAPDFEGVATWLLDIWQTDRANGLIVDATKLDILRQIRNSDEWKAKHSGPGPEPNPSFPTIAGRLRRDGLWLVDDRGPFRWKYVTAFDSPRQYIRGEGDVTRYFDWALSVGANGLRVFCSWRQTGLIPRDIPDFFGWMQNYAMLAAEWGLRVEFCGVQDRIPSTFDQCVVFLQRLADALGPCENATLEFSNEPYDENWPGDGRDVERVQIGWPELLKARGSFIDEVAPYLPSAGYSTFHGRRDADWYRRVGKDCYDISRNVTHDVVIPNEPTKADNTGYSQAEWFIAGAAAALFTAGITAHGNGSTMQLARIPPKNEEDLVRAMFQAVDSVPVEAQGWAYARYGPDAPSVPMPVEDDTWGFDPRMHAKVGEHQAVVLNYRGHLHDWTAQPANGWRIDQQQGPLVLCSR